MLHCNFRENSDGLLIGISTSHPDNSTSKEIYQAALEAVAFQNRDVLEAMQCDSKIQLTTILADGGRINICRHAPLNRVYFEI